MKTILVFLLLIAAAAGLYFVTGVGKDSDTSTDTPTVQRTGTPTGTSVDDPDDSNEALSRVDGGGERQEGDIPAIATAARTDLNEPAARLAGVGEVTGRVVNDDGEGISDAKVVLTLHGSNSISFLGGEVDRSSDVQARTGSDGTFRFTNVGAKPGYALIATHDDYSRTELPGIMVTDGEVTETVDLVMAPGQSVRGTVTDTGGNPVPNAKLTLSHSVFAVTFEGKDDSDALRTTTDEEGVYAFNNVTPMQNYALTVDAEGYGRSSKAAIAVVEGEDTVEDVVLEVASMLAGTVTSVTGEPIEGAAIEAWLSTGQGRSVNTRTKSDDVGAFEFTDVPPGQFNLVASHPEYMRNTTVKATGGDVSISVVMQPRSAVHGQVVDASTGSPITRFTVQLRQAIDGAAGTTQGLEQTQKRVEDPEGRFKIFAPTAGNYLVEAIAPGYADTYSDPFDATLGSDAVGITVRMTRGGTIVGRVVDGNGKPIAGAVVESHDDMWSDDAFWQALGDIGDGSDRSTTSGSDGTFELSGLTPAKYQLVVRHKEYARENVREIDVAEGQEVRVKDIALPEGASVSGSVFGPNGSALAGASVKLLPQVPGGTVYTVQTNKDGVFQFQHVRPMTYKIHAERPRTANGSPFRPTIDMNATQRSLTLREGDDITGEEFRLEDR